MKIKEFPESNGTIAEDQPPYLPLPVKIQTQYIEVPMTSCWGFSFMERLRVLFKGRVYVQLLTFGNKIQPQKLATRLEELV